MAQNNAQVVLPAGGGETDGEQVMPLGQIAVAATVSVSFDLVAAAQEQKGEAPKADAGK